MRNVILKVRLSVGYKTVLSVKSLEVGLCADPNRAFAELVMDAGNRLLDQHMAQAGSADPRRGYDPANAGCGVFDAGGDASGISLQLAGEVMTANVDGLQIDQVHVLKNTALLDHKHLGAQPQDVVERDGGQVVKGLPVPVELNVHAVGADRNRANCLWVDEATNRCSRSARVAAEGASDAPI